MDYINQKGFIRQIFVPLTKVPMTSRGLTDVTIPAIEHSSRKNACVIVKAEIVFTIASNLKSFNFQYNIISWSFLAK